MDDELLLDAPQPAEADANLEALQNLLDGLSAEEDIKYTIYRQTGGNTDQMEFVYSCPASEFTTLDDLRVWISKNHGGGVYRLYVMVDKKLRKNIRLPIAAPKVLESPKTGDSGEVLKFIAEQNRIIMQELQRARAPQGDPMAQAMTMVAAMSQLAGTLVKNARGGSADYTDPLISFDRMLSLADRLNGLRGDKEEPHWMEGVLDKALPLVAAGISAVAGSPAAPASPTALPPPESPPMNIDALIRLPRTILQPLAARKLQTVQPFLAQFQHAATSDADPEIYANVLLDLVPDTVTDAQLTAFLTRDDLVTMLGAIYPPAGPVSTWYERLRTTLLTLLASDDTEPAEGNPT